MRKAFPKTKIASPRIPSEKARSATLNVRATPDEYRRWRRAADLSGMSLSAWVAHWLDELSGGHARVMDVLRKHAPKWDGAMPLEDLHYRMLYRWNCDPCDVDWALRQLFEQSLVDLLVGPEAVTLGPWEPLARLRSVDGRRVTHVALPLMKQPPKRRLY